ncbi:MAG: HEAT repeat domain-containing protein, partial [Planctomycetes bacterium]|nr:HEAT repeat domain-containing protein [Planctomycetota bacterium]
MSPRRFPVLAAVALLAAALAEFRPAAAQPLDPALEKARQEARSEDRGKRRAAMEALLGADEEGKALLRPILARRIENELRALRAFGRSPAGKALRQTAATRLEAARKEALAVIYDRSIYPEENHGIVGQPIVDEKVGKVRALWERPARTLRAEFPALDALLADLELNFALLPRTGGIELPPDLPDLEACLALADRAVDMPSIDTGSTRSRREEQVREAIRQVEAEATPGEIKVVELLNDYRRMMGRLPLAPHLLLMRAARKHSQEMEDLNYFSHTSPTPELRTPSMRAAREGYGGSCAENIARAGSPEGAHEGWYNSSGHHRNMLGQHRVIGLGRSKGGGFWTQMLGSGGLPSGAKTPEAPDWLTYVKRAAAIPARDLDSQLALAEWCRGHGLLRAAERACALVLEQRPDDPQARKILGEVQGDGRWVHAAEAPTAENESPAARIKALEPGLKHDDPYHRLRAVRALAQLFEPAAEPLVIRALDDDHPDVRIEALLGLMAGIGPRVESSLKGRLRDKNPRVRHFAAAALYRRGDAAGVR